MADIPFARALGSAQRGEGISSEKGVIGVTLAHHENALSLDCCPGPNTQYPTKGIGHTVTP